jgi:hypothetical protein
MTTSSMLVVRLVPVVATLGIVACGSVGGSAPPGASDAEPPREVVAEAGAEPVDSGAPTEGGAAPSGPCNADNSPSAVAARDGFLQVCADPATNPEAVCGDGTPYRFSYRPANGPSQGLLVYFKGGGNCTDYVSCWGKDGKGGEGRRVGTMENTRHTEPYVLPPSAGSRTFGYFDRVEATSPFAAFDAVYVSYCTGDGGIGTPRIVDLARPSGADPSAPAVIRTYFHGEHNVKVAVAFAKQQFPQPKRVTIVGSSAGAYASLTAVPLVVSAYAGQELPIAYYGEGGLGVGRASYIDEGNAIIGRYNGTLGNPLVRFTQFTHISDERQVEYAPPAYATPSAFQAAARALMESRAAANPMNYRYFAVDGACHTVAQTPALYQQFAVVAGKLAPKIPAVRPNPDLSVQGTNLVEWVGALVGGNGPFGAELPNRAGDWTTISTVCNLPLSGDG